MHRFVSVHGLPAPVPVHLHVLVFLLSEKEATRNNAQQTYTRGALMHVARHYVALNAVEQQ